MIFSIEEVMISYLVFILKCCFVGKKWLQVAKVRGFLHGLVASVSEEHAGILKINKEQCIWGIYLTMI